MVKEPRKDGRFEAKGLHHATGRRVSFYSRISKADAKRQANESTASYKSAHRALIEADIETLYGYYSSIYLATVVNTSGSWQTQIGWAMDKHVLPELGHRRLDSVKRHEWQAHFNRLIANGMKPSSARRIKIVVSGVYNLAISDEVLANNPVRSVRLPPGAQAGQECPHPRATLEALLRVPFGSPPGGWAVWVRRRSTNR